MILLILLFLFMYLFHILTKDYLNPYKLIMIFGKKGSGKTTLITKLAIQHMNNGWKVYSTVKIPGTYYFDVNRIGFITFPENSVIFIDEVGMIWDNRDFKNFKPEVRDYFKFQRQYKNKVYLFSQTFDVDLKLRNLTDQMFLLTNFARVFSIVRKINKNITIAKGKDGQPSTLADDYSFEPFIFPGAISFTFIPRYVCFFKSYNPKPLNTLTGLYCEPNDIQSKLFSTKFWFFFSLKNILSDLLSYFVRKFNIKNKSSD